MPRAPRLDAPGAMHHVMIRGLERRVIFRDAPDRRDFLNRLGTACERTGARVLAWALLPNHAHLLLRSGAHGLSALMRQVLTGYAGTFNRRHHRHGHLFQNRFKSILVERGPYLLQLVRYLHLNPVRAGLVRTLAELDRYPWTGHAHLMGRRRAAWQDVDTVLAHFGQSLGAARHGYREFVATGWKQGRRPELAGGGLRRSRAGWEALAGIRRGREQWAFDERVLGSSDFVTQVIEECAGHSAQSGPSCREAEEQMEQLVRRMAAAAHLSVAELTGGGKQRHIVPVRLRIAAAARHDHGLPVAIVAHALGISRRTVVRASQASERAPATSMARVPKRTVYALGTTLPES
ncbi:MAG: hypothetical protein H6Q33_3921 [Deltaproteobacteria bacterium]|nr:hypothetical protein [Deltaproteobacteria bacterium]